MQKRSQGMAAMNEGLYFKHVSLKKLGMTSWHFSMVYTLIDHKMAS